MKGPVRIEKFDLFEVKYKWFKGLIYVDMRAKIGQFEMEILDQFIKKVMSNVPKKTAEFQFDILIHDSGDGSGSTVDVFATLGTITFNEQNLVPNAFFGVHWAIKELFDLIVKVGDGLIEGCNLEDQAEDLRQLALAYNNADGLEFFDGSQPLSPEKPETIN